MTLKETKYAPEDIKRMRVLTLLMCVLAAGIAAGTIFYCLTDNKAVFLSDKLSHGFIKLSQQQSVISVFYRSVSWTSMFVILLMLSGFCAISQLISISLLFYRGAALGMAVSYMYGLYGSRAVPAVIIMVLPHALFTSVILLLAVRESVRFSNLSFLYIVRRLPDDEERPELKLYMIRFAVLLFLVLISAVIDCVITYFTTDMLIP
ncbi:MAG: hypothetical protein Q4F95_05720 [Oscillospiraceae bacterium]|nr:hypothetical protein [Oscillospiraceae bacterium]